MIVDTADGAHLHPYQEKLGGVSPFNLHGGDIFEVSNLRQEDGKINDL